MKKPIFIISGPSGAGEDTIIEALKKDMPIDKIVTTTTRKKRKGEKHGKDYYFLSEQEFDSVLKNNGFFEHATQYNGKQYGVTHKEIQRVINSQKIGIWKIEYQGVIKAKELLGDDVVTIFISVPLDQLKKRIMHRGDMTPQEVEDRMEYSKKWMEHKDIYDYEVDNSDGQLNVAISRIKEIIQKFAIDKN